MSDTTDMLEAASPGGPTENIFASAVKKQKNTKPPPGVKPKPGKPYLWVTWITKFLAGETQCEYFPWVKAHYATTKRPRDFDFAAYQTKHTGLVRQLAAELEAKGYAVTIEDANAFKWEGQKVSVIVAGKIDLVAVKGDRIEIWDVKGGEQHASDWWQVLIYIMAYLVLLKGQAWEIVGFVKYDGRTVEVPAAALDELDTEGVSRRQRIGDVVKRFAGSVPLPAVPSPAECSRCDVNECAYRDPNEVKVIASDDF